LELFLPTLLPKEYQNMGFELWFKEFMTIWKSCQDKPSWEKRIISLFSRLASDTIGFIDWNPFIPTIFTRLRNTFSSNDYSIEDAVVWFVSMLGPNSSCQKYITQLFKSIQTYYYPSNTQNGSERLQNLLNLFPKEFCNRLHRERYADKSWLPSVPESHRLREEDINDFVNSLMDVMMISMFSQSGKSDSETCLRYLAQLSPEIVLPKVMHKINTSLDTLTEPQRMIASIDCLNTIASTIFMSTKQNIKIESHLYPLLTSLLEGLDVNDSEKLRSTFTLFGTFAELMPIIGDESELELNNFTEIELKLCLTESQFEKLVLELIERCFKAIENISSINAYRLDRDNCDPLTDEQIVLNNGLNYSFKRILSKCSPLIFEVIKENFFKNFNTQKNSLKFLNRKL
jgi:proteasome activator subunit 4